MLNDLLQLFWSFCKIGFTSFGGMSMIPLINDEMVTHGWMNASEVSDIVAIAEMTPGPIGLNCATFAGMRVVGVAGALTSVVGMLMPTFTLCALAAVFFQHFKESRILKKVMSGVRPVSVGIIFSVMLSLSATNYILGGSIDLGAAAIGLVSFFLLVKKKWTVPKTIVLAAALGLLLCR